MFLNILYCGKKHTPSLLPPPVKKLNGRSEMQHLMCVPPWWYYLHVFTNLYIYIYLYIFYNSAFIKLSHVYNFLFLSIISSNKIFMVKCSFHLVGRIFFFTDRLCKNIISVDFIKPYIFHMHLVKF